MPKQQQSQNSLRSPEVDKLTVLVRIKAPPDCGKADETWLLTEAVSIPAHI